jgi:hypothetical protein
MIPYLMKLGQTDIILCAYNFSMPPDMEMENTIAAARQAGIGIVAMKTMAGGFARIQLGDRLYTDNPKALTDKLKHPGAMVSAMKWVLPEQERGYRHRGHHRPRPARRKRSRRGAAVHGWGPPTAGRANGLHPAPLLPHVRSLRRSVPARSSGGGHASDSQLRRRLRPVPHGPR